MHVHPVRGSLRYRLIEHEIREQLLPQARRRSDDTVSPCTSSHRVSGGWQRIAPLAVMSLVIVVLSKDPTCTPRVTFKPIGVDRVGPTFCSQRVGVGSST